jgi:hypothetical protein
MNAGAQSELPTMIIVFRFPFEGERRLRGSLGADRRQAIHYKPARQAAGTLPRIAVNFNVERATIMRARSRQSRQRTEDHQTANYKSP